MRNRKLLLLWMILPLFTSCITTNNFKSIKVELYQKGMLDPDSIDTVAIFNRDYSTIGQDTFYYKDVAQGKMIKDTLIKYKDLSNTCTDVLAAYLSNSGYFKAVINFRDSMNNLAYDEVFKQRLKQQDSLKFDACVYLDFIGLQDELMTNNFYFDDWVITNFPEFEKSTMMETVGTRLRWTVVLKNDSAGQAYRRVDNLFYGNSVNNTLFGGDGPHRKLLRNTAGVLGESFANELIPHYQMDNRIYYHSHNPQMLMAEKKLWSGDYLGAAEIYNRLTANKNKNIVAKATYNMALICEIEGSIDASYDWLARSASAANKYDFHHFSRCTGYIAVLKKRQKELELLNKQYDKVNNNAAVQ